MVSFSLEKITKRIRYCRERIFLNGFTIILVVVLGLQSVYAGSHRIPIPSTKKSMGWAYNTEEEFEALPEYCKARFYPANSSISKKWSKVIGQDFIHFHHYCRGLTLLRRGNFEYKKEKKHKILLNAIGEMDYTLFHSSKKLNYKFRALMHYKKAEAYSLMGQPQNAYIEKKKSDILLKRNHK